jgi:DNA-binding FadR family transcriptional regulator
MTAPIQPLNRPPSLHHSVQDAIKEYILTNTLRPGDPLPSENELSRQLGVSRNSVREAVKSLESLGVLETRRGSGLFLQHFSFEPMFAGLAYGLLFDLHDLAELLELRRAVETGFIEAAIKQVDAPQLEELRGLVERMRQRAKRGQGFPDEDRAFHCCLYERLGNRMLLRLIDTFWLAFSRAVQHAAVLTDATPLSTYQDHLEIVDAIAARDVPRARLALEQHYAGIQAKLEHAQSAGEQSEQALKVGATTNGPKSRRRKTG